MGPKVGFEAVGIIDSSLPTVGVWAKTSGELDSKVSQWTGAHKLVIDGPVHPYRMER